MTLNVQIVSCGTRYSPPLPKWLNDSYMLNMERTPHPCGSGYSVLTTRMRSGQKCPLFNCIRLLFSLILFPTIVCLSSNYQPDSRLPFNKHSEISAHRNSLMAPLVKQLPTQVNDLGSSDLGTELKWNPHLSYSGPLHPNG